MGDRLASHISKTIDRSIREALGVESTLDKRLQPINLLHKTRFGRRLRGILLPQIAPCGLCCCRQHLNHTIKCRLFHGLFPGRILR